MSCKIIAMNLLVWSILPGTGTAKPLDNEDYRQYQNSGGNSYAPSLLSPGNYGSSQNGFPSLPSNPNVFMPQSVPQSSLSSFGGSSPFGGQSYAANNYRMPGAYSPGLPNFFG